MTGANRKVRLDGVTYTAQQVAEFAHIPLRQVLAILDQIKHVPIAPQWAMFHKPSKSDGQ